MLVVCVCDSRVILSSSALVVLPNISFPNLSVVDGIIVCLFVKKEFWFA